MFTNKDKLKINKTNTETIQNHNNSYYLISYVFTQLHFGRSCGSPDSCIEVFYYNQMRFNTGTARTVSMIGKDGIVPESS